MSIDFTKYEDKLSERAQQILGIAIEESNRRQHFYLGVEHVFLAFVELEPNLVADTMKRLGVDYIFELVEKTEHELLNSKNFGKKSLEEIISKLTEYNLGLGQKIPEALRSEFKEKFQKKENIIEVMED